MRNDYEGKPVVFIAVNSGNSKSAVEGYAKGTGFEWPILVDESRATERAYGIAISLSNIYQWFVVDPGGALHQVGSSADGARLLVDRYLPSAKLFFDGIDVPEKLKPHAQAIEMGTFEPAVAVIAALARRKSSSEAGSAAVEMYKRLSAVAEEGLKRAAEHEEAGRLFAAYTEYDRVARWFRKTDHEKTAAKKLSTLKRDKSVKEELAAQKMLEKARSLLVSKRTSDQKSARAYLQAIAKKYPETEAGKEAARLAR